MRRSEAGFNLLEILFALMLLGFVISLSIETSSGDIAGYQRMKAGTLARWVAFNQLAEVQLGTTFPATGKQSGDEEMGGIHWQWKQEISSTADDDLHRVDVSVFQAGKPDERVAIEVGYVANPQPKPKSQAPAATP
jgi:general secretion pathway protein I